jgi:hypothetical protein
MLAIALLAVPAILVPGMLRVRGAPAYVVGSLVTAAAVIVAAASATSVVSRFGTTAMLLSELVAAAAAIAGWRFLGYPQLRRPARPRPREIFATARANGLLTAFAGLMVVALAIQLFQALTVVSNAWDPNAYHLSRAAFWIQNQSVTQFPGGTVRELGYPPNAEILYAWTMLTTHSDYVANVVQWLALIGCGVAIYGLARALAFPRAGSALAGLLFVAMPIPLLEATTAQNDNVAAFFLTAAALFGVRAIRDRHLGELALGSVALGLAIGTKGIILVAGVALLIIVVAALVIHRPPRRFVALGAVMVVASFAALGAYNFVLNVKNTGDLYGDARAGIERTSGVYPNSVRVDWGFADWPGVAAPTFDLMAQRWLPDLFGSSDGLAGFPYVFDSKVDDSQSAFGPIIPFFLLPIVLGYAIGPRSLRFRRIWAIACIAFVLAFPLSAEASPDLTRLAAPGIARATPLLAVLGRRPVAGAAIAAASVIVIPCVLSNPYKPLLVPEGAKPAHRLSRLEQIGIGNGPVAAAVFNFDQQYGPKAPIGYVGPWDGWPYPWFGQHLERRVMRMSDTTKVTIADMRRQKVVGDILERTPAPPGLKTVPLSDTTVLVLPEPAGSAG